MYSSITQYFWDVYQEGGWYLDDLVRDGSQFVYGRRKGEKEKRIYFVDIEPRLDYLDTKNPLTHMNLFISAFEWLTELVLFMEHRLGTKLDFSRQKLLDFANSIPESHDYFSFVQEAKEKLESR